MRSKPITLVFYAFLGAFAVLFFLLPRRDYSEREKRYLAAFPALSAPSLADGSVRADFEDWYADHFPLRGGFVGLNAYARLAEGRNAQQEIYYAKGGCLVNAPKDAGTEQFEKNLARFDAFAAAAGLPASTLLVPSPGEVNRELLPAGHGDYQNDELYALAARTLSAAPLHDARAALSAANGERPVCYRTDHHLTEWGCYTLYTDWRAARGLPCRPADEFTVTAHGGFYGTTWSGSGYWLVPPDTLELWDSGAKVRVTIDDGGGERKVSDSLFFPAHLDELDQYPVYLDGNHALTTIENADADGGTLLVVKDSYAHGLAPFLAADYRTVYLLDLRYYRGSVSAFAAERGVDELLFLYGVDGLLTDTNSAWLS